MIADLADHPFAVHLLDGPQGSRGVIKAGLVSLARLSGAPVFPVYASVDHAWVLGSWDQCLIPKPFSTVTFAGMGRLPFRHHFPPVSSRPSTAGSRSGCG